MKDSHENLMISKGHNVNMSKDLLKTVVFGVPAGRGRAPKKSGVKEF